jgi:hypothetical protein
MYEHIGEKNSKVMRTIGIENGTAYMIKYLAEPGQFSVYLPVAQTMIDSFQPSLTRTSVSAEPRPSLSSPVNGTCLQVM